MALPKNNVYQQLTIFSDFMLESSKHAPYVYIFAEYFSFEYHFIWNLYDFLFDPIWALMKCSTVLPFSGALAVKNHLSKTIFDLIQHRKIYWIAYDMSVLSGNMKGIRKMPGGNMFQI